MQGQEEVKKPSFLATQTALKFSNYKQEDTFKVIRGKYTSYAQVESIPSVLGTTTVGNGELVFTPLLHFEWETHYTAFIDKQPYHFKLELPETYPRLRIVTVYPKQDILPANLLKWYVKFSKPINLSKIYDHISIRDAQGQVVDRAILPLSPPLISEDGTLLTLWIEPGRQKRGLGPNTRLGSVFTEGESYTLIIDENLKDMHGVSIATSFKHSFTIGTPDRRKPQWESWQVTSPDAGTKHPLHILCSESLDYGSLTDGLIVYSDSTSPIAVQTQWDESNKSISVEPLSNWKKGSYYILLKKSIEDISGNNLERLFDSEVTDSLPKNEDLRIYFTIN